MNVGTFLFLALAVLQSLVLPRCLAQLQNPALHHVRVIHVGAMGHDDESERFRLLLENELRRVGFEVVGKAEDADAILTGAHSAEVHGDKALARATVVLKTRSGKQIWSGDYVSQHWGEGANETVKTTAENCADGLRKDWEKAGKSAR
jgi:hypothetical protein